MKAEFRFVGGFVVVTFDDGNDILVRRYADYKSAETAVRQFYETGILPE